MSKDKKKLPSLPLYAGDFMQDTQQWDDEMVGLHIRLLCIQWTNGKIEADKNGNPAGFYGKRLKLWKRIAHKYVLIEGNIFSQRLEKERLKVNEVIEKRSQAGKDANAKRWADYYASQTDNKRIGNGLQMESQKTSISISKLNTDTNINPLPPKQGVEFPFPDSFKPKWNEWKQYRSEKRKAIKPGIEEYRALKKLFSLANGSEETAVKIVEESMSQGWTGLYVIKTDKKNDQPGLTLKGF